MKTFLLAASLSALTILGTGPSFAQNQRNADVVWCQSRTNPAEFYPIPRGEACPEDRSNRFFGDSTSSAAGTVSGGGGGGNGGGGNGGGHHGGNGGGNQTATGGNGGNANGGNGGTNTASPSQKGVVNVNAPIQSANGGAGGQGGDGGDATIGSTVDQVVESATTP